MFEKALSLNANASLERLSRIINGDERFPIAPLINIELNLKKISNPSESNGYSVSILANTMNELEGYSA
jgi:hypothetical protein